MGKIYFKERLNLNHISRLNKSARPLMLLLITLGLSSCMETSNGKRKKELTGRANNSSTVNVGYGRILQANPIVLSGNSNLSPDYNLNILLEASQTFITNNQFLIGECTNLSNCYQVRDDKNSTLFSSSDGKWGYDTHTDEFLQVHTFGHMKKSISYFHSILSDAYNSGVGNINYQTSIPGTLFSNYGHWDGTNTMIAYSDCDVNNNAYFSPATFSMCFGTDAIYDNVKFAEDPSVIYHELGHAFNRIWLNTRNVVAGVASRTNMGSLFYDEAGGIGEGLSDYISYVITGVDDSGSMTKSNRTHMGEWALGRFNNASRPVKENDSLHAPGISTSSDSRLSYPTYLTYNPNQPSVVSEDIHYAGQIISHFLVALTEDLKSECSLSQAQAIKSILYILTETFAELGDLTAKGNDSTPFGEYAVNLNPDHAKEWIYKNNPINYRRFVQTMAKYLLQIFGPPGCYNQDSMEELMDSYGLLLFKTYNENGNSAADNGSGTPKGHDGTNTSVTTSNRVQTVLIDKDLLILDPNSGEPDAFIFDDREDMVAALSSLQSSGQIGSISNQLESDLPYNNGNAQISPGELVGVSLNLYNNSNSTMAGVQVLANDWDHVKDSKPCNTFEDEWPTVSEGGADSSSEASPYNVGDCNYITRSNGDDGDEIAPVCFVQINDSDATRWAMQDELIEQISMDPSNCLGGSGEKENCFIRAIDGADQAYYSKIDPKTTFAKTLIDSEGNPQFNMSNIVFFEVSPWIPPGTTFNCRFRARFGNCDDCYSDSDENDDDFLDYEYSGADPFRIINFKFTVID